MQKQNILRKYKIPFIVTTIYVVVEIVTIKIFPYISPFFWTHHYNQAYRILTFAAGATLFPAGFLFGHDSSGGLAPHLINTLILFGVPALMVKVFNLVTNKNLQNKSTNLGTKLGIIFSIIYFVITIVLLILGNMAAQIGPPNADLSYGIPLMLLTLPGYLVFSLIKPLFWFPFLNYTVTTINAFAYFFVTLLAIKIGQNYNKNKKLSNE